MTDIFDFLIFIVIYHYFCLNTKCQVKIFMSIFAICWYMASHISMYKKWWNIICLQNNLLFLLYLSSFFLFFKGEMYENSEQADQNEALLQYDTRQVQRRHQDHEKQIQGCVFWPSKCLLRIDSKRSLVFGWLFNYLIVVYSQRSKRSHFKHHYLLFMYWCRQMRKRMVVVCFAYVGSLRSQWFE